jgi:hypothetical protein
VITQLGKFSNRVLGSARWINLAQSSEFMLRPCVSAAMTSGYHVGLALARSAASII